MAYNIFDQFETEPNAFYSGSYTDAIYQGNLGDPQGRYRIVSKTSGSVEALYAQFFSQFADNSGSNSNRKIGTDLRFRSFTSANELYQDTILPDLHECFLINGGIPTLSLIEAGLYPVILDRGSVGNPVGKLVFSTYGTTASYVSSGTVNVGDSTWFGSFPFQYRYRSAKRNVIPTVSKFNVLFPASESQLSYNNIAYYGVNQQTYKYGLLATIEVILPRISPDFYPTVSGPAQTEPLRYALLDVTGAVSVASGTFGTGVTLYPPPGSGIFGVGFGTIRPPESLLIKMAYGFGDFWNNVATMETAVTSSKLQWVAGVCNYYYASSVNIRGWRYGVINGFPQYTSCIFRSSHYGQFRDMLEQRKLSKFFDINGLTTDGKNNAKKGVTNAAVQVSFLSGSKSFVTASSPSSLNPNDSGIYDFECKSGSPWRDI